MEILKRWNQLSKFPGGKFLFSLFIGRFVPYSGTIHAEVLEIRPGFARVKIPDRKQNRNHLHSVHAVALMNVSELTSGLALLTSVPPEARAILVGFSIEFIKKARGDLIGEATHPISNSTSARDDSVEVAVKNQDGEVVCRAKAQWKIGPQK